MDYRLVAYPILYFLGKPWKLLELKRAVHSYGSAFTRETDLSRNP
jgi:hypothetical protein